MIDLLFTNGIVVSELDEQYVALGVDGETIVYLGPNQDAPAAKRTIDCQGKYVIPGLIDPHYHIGQAPGPPPPIERWRDDVGPETRAATRGGVTTLFAMYARRQPYVPIIKQLIEWGNRDSYVDFNFHPIMQSEEHVAEMDALYEMGVTTYKFFFDAYKGWEGEQIALNPLDAGLLYRAFVKIASLGDSVALIHAEDQDLIYELQQRSRDTGRVDLGAWTDTRPAVAELTKSYAVIEMAKTSGAGLYLVHVGAGAVADLVERERKAGYSRIFAETCAHYLTHNQEMEERVGCWAKVNNAIKTPDDSERLWRAINSGGITNMGTDHVTWTRAEKENGGGQFNNIWSSLPGISGGSEHWLPAMLTFGVRAGRISMSDLVRVTSTANARTFGLYPRKGVLAVGSDADITVVDPERRVTVVPSEFYASPPAQTWSIYEGWEFEGMPIMTVVRGSVVMENGEVVAGPSGRYIHRPVRRR
jgi:dihydropyrimidinase/dihydroorotase